MISGRGLARLRVAATLTHTLPRVRARVRVGDDVLLDVLAPNADAALAGPSSSRVLSPCAFRCAVAQAHRAHQAGRQLSFLHLPEGVEPAIDIATPASGAARPGGLYRVPLERRWLWAFATTLDATAAYDVGRDFVSGALPVTGVHALGIRPDPATDVSVAYAETAATPGSAAERDVVDLLEALLACWTTHEFLTSLAGVDQGVHDPRTV